ncbi:MAG: hypothetical protein IKP28_01490 [Clostridia bacterium]|nr:hypothetical protein [Clostridia bacterium]
MTHIYYGISGEEQWIVISESNPKKSVERLKEFISRGVVQAEEITMAYLWFSGKNNDSMHSHCQIHAFGENTYEVDISCRNEDGTADTVAIAECLVLLGFHLDEKQKRGIFEVHPSGNFSEKFIK